MSEPHFRVLIVDDESDITESVEMIVESFAPEVEVILASDGQVALDRLEEIGGEEPVGLIMSDYRMPNMDGIEFLSKVRDKWPRVARIMLTAYPDPELAIRAAKEAGVGLFIAKPFDPQYVGDLLSAFAHKHDAQLH